VAISMLSVGMSLNRHLPQSQDSCADPPTPHISLHSPPNPHHRFSLACTQQDSIPDITDASWRTLKIQYDSSDSSVVAWLSDDEDSTVTSRTTPNAAFVLLWQAKLPTSSGRTLSYRLGITAATGGFAQAVSFCQLLASVLCM
jgi:peptide-N4-(N-acetyl-beta-glucosaminyl)asparagine amidase